MLETLQKLFDILPASDRWKFGILLLLMFFGTLLEVIGIGMLPVFISAVSDPDYILQNEWIGPFFADIGIINSKDLLTYGGISLVVIFVVKGGYLVWLQYLKSKFVFNRFSLIASKLFESYLSSGYTFHLQRNTAELIRNVTNETRYISNQVMMPFLSIIMQGVTVLGIFILLLLVEPLITIMAIFLLGGAGGLFLKLLRDKLKSYGNIASKERSRMIQGVNEGLGGIKDISLMNRQWFFMKRFNSYVNNLSQAEIFRTVTNSASKPIIESIAVIGMIGMAFFMVWQGRPMGSIIPVLTLFGAATVRLMPAINQIVMEINRLRYYIYALKPVHSDIKLLEREAQDIRTQKEITKKLLFKNKIELKNVSFTYPNSQELALDSVSLGINKGSVVGFVGESGAGKSTVVDIILGLLEPTEGVVLVDGIDIQSEKRKWQNNVGYIPQFIYLSDDTIRNNIAFGIPEDKIAENKLRNAVKAAQLDKIIQELPEGLDTIIGEDGVRLSGGQRQRIGIARALYDNPAVLIMDEATSALDNITEKEVIKSIELLRGERTIIMIAHRLTTVQNCDELFLLSNGKIAESGAYDELIEKNAVFKRMSTAD